MTKKKRKNLRNVFNLRVQLSAAPTPAPYEEIVSQGQATMNNLSSQGQQYGNYAMNEASANGQYAVDQMKSNSQYAVDQMKTSGQQAVDAGKNLVNKAQNSIGNISLNPLSYMPSWMQPDPQNLSNMIHQGMENGQYYYEKAKEKGQEISNKVSGMAQSLIGQGKDLTRGGIQQGAQSVQSMGGYEKSYLGSLGEKLDNLNGYIAEKLYKTADGVGNLSIPNLDQQLYSY